MPEANAVVLAVDGMGGDGGPAFVVEGLALARQRYPGVHFLLYGDEAALGPLVAASGDLSSAVTLRHTEECVAADTKPSAAVRGFKRSSMRLALETAAAGEAHGVVSAGNTGAYMALSKMVLKTLPGIDRPAIAGQFPTAKGESVMLDLGANVTCTPRNLVEFALMGEKFAKHVLGIPHPTVGLLNVGSEAGKGTPYLTETLELLERTPIRLYGFIEGDDIAQGTVDVVVADGFTGNVALKTAEGMVRFIFQSVVQNAKRSFLTRVTGLLALPVLKALSSSLDPRKYNGAVWLGLNGVAVKSHGGTDPVGFSHAVTRTIGMVNSGLNAYIAQELEKLQEF